MKNKFIVGSLFILWLVSSMVTLKSLSLQRAENLRLRREYCQFLEIEKSLNDSKNSVQGQEILKDVGDVIRELNLKENVSQIRPQGREIEIVFQNLSQDQMIRFLESLNKLKGARMIRADLSKSSSDLLSFSVVLTFI